jgi:hypothetical protein
MTALLGRGGGHAFSGRSRAFGWGSGLRRYAIGLAISSIVTPVTMPLLAFAFLALGAFARRGGSLLALLARTVMAMTLAFVPRTAILIAAAGPPDFHELRLCGCFRSCRSFRCCL